MHELKCAIRHNKWVRLKSGLMFKITIVQHFMYKVPEVFPPHMSDVEAVIRTAKTHKWMPGNHVMKAIVDEARNEKFEQECSIAYSLQSSILHVWNI